LYVSSIEIASIKVLNIQYNSKRKFMKKTHFKIFNLVMTAMLYWNLTGCASNGVQRYGENLPQFDVQQFFVGALTAHGVVKNRSGQVIRSFNADIQGRIENNVGILEESFIFSDGEHQRRVWQLRPTSAGELLATANDVIGEGKGRYAGNALNLRYTLQIDYGGKPLNLDVDDWMFLVNPTTVINESVLTKFGIRVGSIQLVILKH